MEVGTARESLSGGNNKVKYKSMIVDKILDRKDGLEYSAKAFYNEVAQYGEVGFGIADALDGGENEDVQKELVAYIKKNEYPQAIAEYVLSVAWL